MKPMEILCENPRPQEMTELIDLVSTAFKYPEPDKVARDFPLLYTLQNREHLWVVRDCDASKQTKIVAHAGCLLVTQYIDAFPLRVGGIGGVASHEAARGKGYARTVVEHCCADLKSQGAALAYLWSSEHDFFRKQGFALVGRQWSIPLAKTRGGELIQAAESLARDQGAELATWEIREGVAALGKEAAQMLNQHPLRVERSPEAFQTLLASPGVRVFSAHRNGSLSAYLLVGKGMDLKNHIHEWAGSELALLALTAHALRVYAEDLVLLSPQFSPQEAPWVYTLEKLGFPAQPGFHAMVKLLDFSAVRALLLQKARSLGMEPSFLRCERMDDNSYCLGWATDPDLYMTEQEFLSFLFGPDLPSEQVELAENSTNAFNALLPLRAWWWGMDSV